MSNIGIIIEERPADIGHFLVGRLLPFRDKRMVGPFVFIDHMGPVRLSEHQNVDIGPHPHIGLSTLTYLFEGAILHRDSLGTEMEITPGQVNWMTAGGGIVHSERTPPQLRHSDKNLHGLQIWVALPKELEEMPPAFFHADENELPAWEHEGVSYKLIAGEVMGRKSPIPVFSRLYMLEIKSSVDRTIRIGPELYGEAGLYILEGGIESEGITYEPRRILVAKSSQLCEFVIRANSTIYVFGGEPFPEPRQIFWNFVSSRSERIEQAKQDWQEGRFPAIAGESDPIPLPLMNSVLKPKK